MNRAFYFSLRTVVVIRGECLGRKIIFFIIKGIRKSNVISINYESGFIFACLLYYLRLYLVINPRVIPSFWSGFNKRVMIYFI